IELPMENRGGRDFAETGELRLECLRFEAVLLRCPNDVERGRSIARYSARLAELRERNEAAVIREHHPEARGTALRRLHLGDEGHRTAEESEGRDHAKKRFKGSNSTV